MPVAPIGQANLVSGLQGIGQANPVPDLPETVRENLASDLRDTDRVQAGRPTAGLRMQDHHTIDLPMGSIPVLHMAGDGTIVVVGTGLWVLLHLEPRQALLWVQLCLRFRVIV